MKKCGPQLRPSFRLGGIAVADGLLFLQAGLVALDERLDDQVHRQLVDRFNVFRVAVAQRHLHRLQEGTADFLYRHQRVRSNRYRFNGTAVNQPPAIKYWHLAFKQVRGSLGSVSQVQKRSTLALPRHFPLIFQTVGMRPCFYWVRRTAINSITIAVIKLGRLHEGQYV